MTLLIISMLWVFCLLNLALPMHPLSLGLMVLFLAFASCLLSAIFNAWYAYILFFVFIGGMLVMFAYIASLAPNTIFTANNQTIIILAQILASMIVLKITTPLQMYSSINYDHSIMYSTEPIIFLYLPSGAPLLLMLACILLFTMVIAVKLCSFYSGALRPYLFN
uniref:NADH-ubiquinone oxidoreductase chain 6 n=1 Tax=Neotrigonia margaritacea TaxID=47539 RepID=A0A1X9JUR4_9BIVA|nr:NADH dehydrogenase subunit 6 [Neotrigonia margaritacea]AQT38493.1 NADH dehydrogenase subunit 6 [Neotrigonia margaritacea]